MFLINSVVFYLLVLYLLPYSSTLIRHFLPLLLFFSFAIKGGIISLPPAVSGIEHSVPLFIQKCEQIQIRLFFLKHRLGMLCMLVTRESNLEVICHVREVSFARFETVTKLLKLFRSDF